MTIARVEASRLDAEQARRAAEWCDRNKVGCAFLLADSGDAETAAAAEGVGFDPVDTRVTLVRAGGAAPPAESGKPVRPGEEADLAALEPIARTAHTDTRFFFDPHFSDERAGDLYATWVRNALLGERGSLVVAESEDVAAGYLVLGSDPVSIDLIAVAPDHRGRGLGRDLAGAAIAAAGGGEVRVVTQARNARATSFYEALGFTMTLSEIWFHRWR